MARRLLLISYHFPPSEAAGALRWQRLAPMAVAKGWEVEAITLAPDQAERADWSRVRELPPGVTIHGVEHPEPWSARIDSVAWRVWRSLRPQPVRPRRTTRPLFSNREEVRKLGGGARAVIRTWNALMAWQRELAWVQAAVRQGKRIGTERAPDAVLSCGPPHLVHEAGRRLAAGFQVPFVMDMRDTWTIEPILPEDQASPLWFRLAERAEARCVCQADLIVMNTALAAAAMKAKWGHSRVVTVMNGWDDEPLFREPWPRQFRVIYAGSIYIDRTPGPLFRAAAQAIRRLDVGPAQFEIRLIGAVDSFAGRSVPELAAEAGIAEYVRLIPPLPRTEVLREYAQAAVLLNLPQGLRYAIPSKLFEYLRQPCWVMAQAPPESAVAQLLGPTSAFVVAPEDVARMTDILVRCYQEFAANRRPTPIAQDGRFSRAAEGGRLFAELESLLASAKRGRR